MSHPPAAVVFDLTGVVFRHHPQRRLDAFARHSGLTAAEVRRRLFDSGFSLSCDAGRFSAEGAWREGTRLLGCRLGRDRFRTLWGSAFEPDTSVVDLVQRLRGRVDVALLTNNSGLVREALERSHPEVMDLFRPRLFSADVGQLKPVPGPFRTLLDLLGKAAEEVLYVDDAPANVDAAASLGFRTCRFHGAEALEAELAAQGVIEP